jgi:hypothetical protein
VIRIGRWGAGQLTFDENGDWQQSRNDDGLGKAAGGALRAALMFGAAAVAFGLIAAPFFEQKTENLAAKRNSASELDNIETGSVNRPARRPGKYTIRRSVLQAPDGEVCIFDKKGEISGPC